MGIHKYKRSLMSI